ncbi:MAG TPA: 4Fe-4S dicluster domain-containing protein [Thermodesulfobacteriota bacterium]|nr:4Fe-4S dicluster domain-containing protein [Thermodesulfobacteriota bacterium]
MMELNVRAIQKGNSFLSEVAQASGETIQACYQCQKCSAGCPVAYAMDILPNQVLRHIQYGHRERVLSSKTIWMCASCYCCSVRCPNNIDIARVMDSLRILAMHSEFKPGEKDVPIFHSAFLDTIKSKGRIHELSLILQFKSKTRDFFKDAALGLKMYRKGKIKLLPSKFGGGKEIKEIFNAFEKGAR